MTKTSSPLSLLSTLSLLPMFFGKKHVHQFFSLVGFLSLKFWGPKKGKERNLPAQYIKTSPPGYENITDYIIKTRPPGYENITDGLKTVLFECVSTYYYLLTFLSSDECDDLFLLIIPETSGY